MKFIGDAHLIAQEKTWEQFVDAIRYSRAYNWQGRTFSVSSSKYRRQQHQHQRRRSPSIILPRYSEFVASSSSSLSHACSTLWRCVWPQALPVHSAAVSCRRRPCDNAGDYLSSGMWHCGHWLDVGGTHEPSKAELTTSILKTYLFLFNSTYHFYVFIFQRQCLNIKESIKEWQQPDNYHGAPKLQIATVTD